MNCPQCSNPMVMAQATNFGPEYHYCRSCKKELSEMRQVFPIQKPAVMASFSSHVDLGGGTPVNSIILNNGIAYLGTEVIMDTLGATFKLKITDIDLPRRLITLTGPLGDVVVDATDLVQDFIIYHSGQTP